MSIRFDYSAIAKCKPEHVWQKFQKLEEWGWWNPVIGKTRWLQGQPWQKGSIFYFELVRPRRMNLKPVIQECAPPNNVLWIGKSPGWVGEHGFSFEAQPDGTTLVKTWENLSGMATAFFGEKMRQGLQDMYAAWVETLKTEAEKTAREEFARS